MPFTVPLRDGYDAAALHRLAMASSNNRQIRRFLALAAVYDGMSRTEAAHVDGMDRQTLRDWVHRFNEEGPDEVLDRPRSGRQPVWARARCGSWPGLSMPAPIPRLTALCAGAGSICSA